MYVCIYFIEKNVSQGKKRSLEPDNDNTKNSSPPKVCIIQY